MSLRIKAVVDRFVKELQEALVGDIEDRKTKEREMQSYIEEREREVAEREAAWKAVLSRREAEIARQEARLKIEKENLEKEKSVLMGTASNQESQDGALEITESTKFFSKRTTKGLCCLDQVGKDERSCFCCHICFHWRLVVRMGKCKHYRSSSLHKERIQDREPAIECLMVAISLVGAAAITPCAGTISDWFGHRSMMIISSLLYFISDLVMWWSPSAYVLLLGRLLVGFGIGLAITIVPVYIAETAPSDVRGLLNTIPQFGGSGGLFLAYCMVFGMSLDEKPKWRLMLGVLAIPSLVYIVLVVFFLLESPRWLVSKEELWRLKRNYRSYMVVKMFQVCY